VVQVALGLSGLIVLVWSLAHSEKLLTSVSESDIFLISLYTYNPATNIIKKIIPTRIRYFFKSTSVVI